MTIRGSRLCWTTPATMSPSRPGELAEHLLVLGVAQPLQDGLPGGGRRDPAEAVRGVVALADRHALLGSISLRPDHDVAVLRVELDPGVCSAPSVRW